MKSCLILLESQQGKLSEAALRMLDQVQAAGLSISKALVWMPEGETSLSLPEGLDAIGVAHSSQQLFIDRSEVQPLLALVKDYPADAIAYVKSYKLDFVASCLAGALGYQALQHLISLEGSGAGLRFEQLIFSGKAKQKLSFADAKLVLGFSKQVQGNLPSTQTQTLSIAAHMAPAACQVKEQVLRGAGIALGDADVVVGAGRGMKAAENWGIIEQLAEKLQAATACSKPVSDLKWRPHHEHVGQTGVKIAPKLYIACGISGAVQHLAGVNGSKTIVVINNDPEAAFMKNADYVVQGDLFEVVPALIAAL